jgi:glutamyl-tRNA reductase
VDTVKALRGHAEQLRDAELEKALKALARGETPEQVLAAMARALTNKFIHNPSIELKRASAEGRQEVVEVARSLHGLPGSNGEITGLDEE